MKKNQEQNALMLQLPDEIQTLCGFGGVDSLSIKAAEGVCVIHAGEMSVLEAARIITVLTEIASDLTVLLAEAAGFCDGCGGLEGETPAQCAAHCTLCHEMLDESQCIHIPDHLLEEADIPKGAKLEAFVDEDSGDIIVTESDIQQNIRDLPQSVAAVLTAAGICLAELDERILLGDTLHG